MKELQTKLYGLTIRARHFRTFNRPDKQDGATAIEYAMIAAIMVGIVGVAFTFLDLQTIFETINDTIMEAIGGDGGGDGGT